MNALLLPTILTNARGAAVGVGGAEATTGAAALVSTPLLGGGTIGVTGPVSTGVPQVGRRGAGLGSGLIAATRCKLGCAFARSARSAIARCRAATIHGGSSASAEATVVADSSAGGSSSTT